MNNTYCVIDLSKLYNNFEPNIAYLDLGLEDGRGKSISYANHTDRKIHIASKRYLRVFYDKDISPRLILKNRETGAYEFIAILMNGTSYDLYLTLLMKGIELSCIEYGQWIDIKGNLKYEKEEMKIYDSVTVLEGYDGHQCHKTMVITKPRINDMDVPLKKIKCCDWVPIEDICIFEKGIHNNQISISDIHELINSTYTVLRIDFGNLRLHFESGMITVYKLLSTLADADETFMFRFKQERVPDLDIFLDFVLKAESENKLVEGINKYFIY